MQFSVDYIIESRPLERARLGCIIRKMLK